MCRATPIEQEDLPPPMPLFASTEELSQKTCEEWDQAEKKGDLGRVLLDVLLSPLRGLLLSGVAASAAQGLLGTVGRFLVLRRLIIDFDRGANKSWLVTLSFIFFLIALFEGLCAVLARQLLAAVLSHTLIAKSNALLMRKVGKIRQSNDETYLSAIYAGDFPRLLGISKFLSMFAAGVTSLLGGVVIIAIYLGVWGLVSLGTMLIVLVAQRCFSNRAKRIEPFLFKARDERVKAIEQAVKGIKAVKFYAWEDQFFDMVAEKRRAQLKVLLSYRLNVLLSVTMGKVFPVLAGVVTLLAVGMSNGGELEASDAFAALAVFQTIRVGMIMLPLSSLLMNTAVAVHRRVATYLDSRELDDVPREESLEFAVTVRNRFKASYDNTPPFILSIEDDVELRRGTLTAVVGPVGSGKTFWVNLLLGSRQNPDRGNLAREASLGYAPQDPFVASGTILENIVLGRHFDQKSLDEAIRIAAFDRDVRLLSHGVDTVIGERGTTLSGGQQARLQVARAFYGSPKLVILDSSLAAVDAAVARLIFENVRAWVDATKNTAILVLSQLHFVSDCDHVLCFDDGVLVAQGTPDDVSRRERDESSSQTFADFLAEKLSATAEASSEDVNDPEETKEQPLDDDEENLATTTRVVADSEEDPASMMILASSKAVDESYATPVVAEPAPTTQLVKREKIQRGGVSMKVLHAWARGVGYWRLCAAVFFFASAVFVLFLSDIALARWTSSDGSRSRRWMYTYAGLALFHLPVLVCGVVLLIYASARGGANLHGRTFRNVLGAPNTWFETEPSGRTLSRFANDTDVVDIEWANQIDAWCTMGSMFVMIVLAISFLVPIVIPINAFAIVGLVYTLQIINIANRDLKRIANAAVSPCVTSAGEAEAGQAILRAHEGADGFYVQKQRKNMDAALSAFFSSSSVGQAAYANATGWCSLMALATSLVVVLAGDMLVPRRLAPIALTYGLVSPYFASMFSEMHLQLCLHSTSLERLFEYLPEFGVVPSEAARHTPADADVSNDWPPKGICEFKQVSLRYRPGLPLALRSASFRLEAGETCAVVGRTGAGKSTILISLFRVVEPCSGIISIDGVDVTRIGLKMLRRRLCLVPQEAVLIRGTGKTNVDPFDDFDDEKVADALETVGLPRSFLDQQLVGDNDSSTLSAGERQLLALARCLLRRSNVVALDEATAHIDSQTDKAVQDIIANEFAHSTRIAIAHRLHTVFGYDKMLVMADGAVAQFGTPFDLMQESDKPLATMLSALSDSARAELREIATAQHLSKTAPVDIKKNV